MSKPNKDKSRILDLNIEIEEKLCKDPENKQHPQYEIAKNWLMRLVKSALNGADPKTGQPTIAPSVAIHKKYADLIVEMRELNDQGIVVLTAKTWEFANHHFQRGTQFIHDDVAPILAQISDRLASAKIVEEASEEKTEDA